MKKSQGMTDAQFLALLQKVLPKATKDTGLASAIYEEVAKEVRRNNHIESFEKFCEKESLPDLEPTTVADLQGQLAVNFGEDNVTVTPVEDGTALQVEIALPDGVVNRLVKVAPPGSANDAEPTSPFVPFPVCLPGDPELVWVLGRRENFASEEAARSLSKIEEEFWATKTGQKLQREGVERTFAEFISNVPASALSESGLRRHYKLPEALRTLRLLPEAEAEAIAAPKMKGADSPPW